MPTIRTSMQPWRDVEVSDAEHLDLQRQGLIHSDESTAPAAAPKKPPAPSAPGGTTKEG